jgi:hypothetical protein
MKYILIRTYGNGKHVNKVYPLLFDWLHQAEKVAFILNERDCDGTAEKWVPMLVTPYVDMGEVLGG